jgi:hypothetical protein
MSARKSAANCYVGSYKRGGPNNVAARASTNRCAWVRVGVVQCCCNYTSLRIGPSTLPVCRFVSERSRQTASVAGCWEARGIPNLAAPAVRARSKSDTECPASFEPSPANLSAKTHRFSVSSTDTAARITRQLPYSARLDFRRRLSSGGLLTGQQRFQLPLLESLVRADGDTIDPPPKLRQRNAVRRCGMPHLNLESSTRCHRIDPTVGLQQTEADDRSFIQAVGGNLDAVRYARRAGEADGARLRRHGAYGIIFALCSP